jgi:hypothetical protein
MAASWRDELKFDEEYDWLQGWLTLPQLATLRIPAYHDDETSAEETDDAEDDGEEAAGEDDPEVEADLKELEAISNDLMNVMSDPQKLLDLMRQANPGVDPDQKMPGSEQTLREMIEESAEQTARVVRGEQSSEFEEHDRKIQAAYEERVRRDRVGQFELTVDTQGERRPSPEQAAAVEYLLANEAHVRGVLLAAAAKYAGEVRAAYADGLTGEQSREFEEALPENPTPADMDGRIDFSSLNVTENAQEGTAYVEYALNCTWDDEHGVMVVLHRDRVVYVGQQGDGWEDEAGDEAYDEDGDE